METLNLNTLASSLPSAQKKAEQELLNNFRAAALSITTLYRSSRQNAKRAYNSGYAAACQDLLTMIQQGVSVGGLGLTASGSSLDADNDGMTIGRVMDWIEARLEAIKTQEDEEDEEEEKEREKERTRPTSSAPPNHSKPAVPSPSPASLGPNSSLPTPSSPVTTTTNHLPEPSPPTPPLHPTHIIRPTQRSKSRTAPKGEPSTPYTNFPAISPTSVLSFLPEAVTPINTPTSFGEVPIIPAVGSKRRHAMMMMLDAATTPTTGNTSTQSSPMSSTPASQASHSNSSRRRMKSTRAQQQLQNQNINVMPPPPEAMDTEDDGRERKRVARR